MPRYAFITVTDDAFFPGTLATVNSVAQFHPRAEIFVVVNHKCPLTPSQVACLEGSDRIRLIDSRELDAPGRYINAWELKAYACHDLCAGYDVIVLIDSDCLLCSNVDDVIERCYASGGLLGGRDGDGADYDQPYSVYGISTPTHNPRYMSTSLMFCAVTDRNRRILRRWTECVSAAQFNGTGPHPGHGDQGVLNAILFAENRTQDVELLDNRLWSQHWTYWESVIEFREGRFCNLSAGGLAQRSFHCGGTDKFWSRAHRDRVLARRPMRPYPYAWFLAMLWFGRWSRRTDHERWLPAANQHLVEDMGRFLPHMARAHPPCTEALACSG